MNAPWLSEDNGSVQRGQFAPPKKKKKKSKFLTALIVLLIAGVIGACVYLGVRLDNQKIDPDPPSSAEQARQDMATQIARIASYSEKNGNTELTSHAKAWLDIVGGVWQPWPDGNPPKGRTNPPYETEPPAQADTTYLIEQLNELSATATDQAGSYSGAQREALIRIAIDAKIWAARVATNAGVDAPAAGTLDMERVAEMADSDMLTALSEARQWLEKDASLVYVTERTGLSARIETITALEEEILANDVADKRPIVAPLPQLKDGQSLTNVALQHIADTLIKGASQANEEQIRAIVTYVYSLYLNDTERAEANILSLK